MKTHRRTTTTHSCGICHTEYRSKKAARDCEKCPIEPLIAGVGDRVFVIEKRQCLTPRRGKSPYYTARGSIAEISPPQPFDMEYELKWLGGRPERLHTHVRYYTVAYKCPRCTEQRTLSALAPEFVVLVRNEANAA